MDKGLMEEEGGQAALEAYDKKGGGEGLVLLG